MKNRIEIKISRTAEGNCAFRAASFFEQDTKYHSDDYIAPKLLPKGYIPFVKLKIIRKFVIENLTPKGIYEYIIARTKYFDEITEKAIINKINQIFIFGAGFDSRAIRFDNLNKAINFFELDAYHTQKAKIHRYKKRNIILPENLTFISINFNNENIKDKLDKCSYNRNKRSLFLLEGLLKYLDENTVIDIFKIIKDFSISHNWLIFDFVYKSALGEENKYYGGSELRKKVKKYNEAWKFGIEEKEVKTYFENLGFKVLDTSNSKQLEKKYFLDNHNNLINGAHSIAWLEVKYNCMVFYLHFI